MIIICKIAYSKIAYFANKKMGFTIVATEGENFIDRKEIVDDMVDTLSDKKTLIGFALYGKRRLGKTSILKEVRRRLIKKKSIVPVYFSIWDIVENNVSGFVRELTTEILEAYRPKLGLKQKAKELLEMPARYFYRAIKSIEIKASIQDDIVFLLKFGEETKEEINYDLLIEGVFNLPEQLALETKTRCILLIDEFPAIMDLNKNGSKETIGEGIIRKIRTIHERQENTVLCISGSTRKTMDLTVFSSTSAFYRQLLGREIKPLEERYIMELITKNLDKRVTGDAHKRIYKLTRGVPFYAQVIGTRLERMKQKTITARDVNTAFDAILREEGILIFKNEFNRLTPKEKIVVRAMAVEDVHTPTKIARKIKETLANTGSILGYLEEKGVIIKKERGFYELEDHVFKEWIKRMV